MTDDDQQPAEVADSRETLRRRVRADDDEVDLDDEVLDEREIAAAIEALRAARGAGFGNRDRRFTGRRHRPGTGDYE